MVGSATLSEQLHLPIEVEVVAVEAPVKLVAQAVQVYLSSTTTFSQRSLSIPIAQQVAPRNLQQSFNLQ